MPIKFRCRRYGLTGGRSARVLDLHNAMYVVTERLAAQ